MEDQRSNRSCKGASYVLQRMYSFVVELYWSRLKSSGLTLLGAVKVGLGLGLHAAKVMSVLL